MPGKSRKVPSYCRHKASGQAYVTIDGREQVRGHGMREMPVWGDVFQTSVADPLAADGSGEERARTKIHELVLYLETIQE